MNDVSEFAAQIEEQKRTIQRAKARKGLKATNKASRRDIERDYARALDDAPHNIRTCYIAPAYPPSTVEVRNLKPITLSELRLETHHAGRVLLVRTFTKSQRLVSVQAGIEDELGDVDTLALYNADPKTKPNQVLPKDTVYAIKEPFYKASAGGGYLVRIDHPSDLIKLPNTHEMVPLALQPRLVELDPSPEARKLEGNQAYKTKDYFAALDKYTQGIYECEEDAISLKSDLLRNRAIVNLFLHRYEGAASDAIASVVTGSDLSIACQKNNSKAYYRAGRALYYQESFEEALDYFQKSLDIVPRDMDCLREIKRTERRLREQTRGDYDLTAISKTASLKHNRMDHASFLKNVEVRDAQHKGRGLFATADLKSGNLIMCEKAFLVASYSDSETEMYTLLNLNTNSGALGTQATLGFCLTQKMLYNPAAADKFFDLYDGGYGSPKREVVQVDGVTVVDTFRVAAIQEYNAFGGPNVRSTDMRQAAEMDEDPRQATGVWVTASYINHACDGNAARSYIGDLMILHATKDIAKGTEITMPYRLPEWEAGETRKTLQKAWRFKCDCDLCVVDAKTGGTPSSRRKQLAVEAEGFLRNDRQTNANRPGKVTVTKAQKLFNQLESTYDKELFEQMPRLGLIDLGLWLLTAQAPKMATETIIDRAIDVLRNCGFGVELNGKKLIVDHTHCFLHSAAVDVAVHAAHAHYFKGDNVVGKQFEDFARKLYVTRSGTDIGFAERYFHDD